MIKKLSLIGTHMVKHAAGDVLREHQVALKFRPATDEEMRKALGSDDVPDGYVAGWASTPDLDTYHHVVAPGAFNSAIKLRGLTGGKGIKLLLNHEWSKGAGVIKTLENRGERLWIEAQLNLNISYVKDAYEAMKMSGGWNFSVGFMLQDYEFKETADKSEYLLIKRGDLYEVSIVPFPGNEECTMEFIKSKVQAPAEPTTVAEFEKMLVARGLVKNRDGAHEIALAVKSCAHLFQKTSSTPPAGSGEVTNPQPVLDAGRLEKLRAQIKKMTETLGS